MQVAESLQAGATAPESRRQVDFKWVIIGLCVLLVAYLAARPSGLPALAELLHAAERSGRIAGYARQLHRAYGDRRDAPAVLELR